MAFKLGKSSKPMMSSGEIKSKMFFDKEEMTSIPGTPIVRKDLGKGILGEANNDGSIFLSKKIKQGSEEEKHILAHEMVHLTDMKVGKLAYNDNYIKWNGETYERKNGKIYYNHEWSPEGTKHFPWEKMPWE